MRRLALILLCTACAALRLPALSFEPFGPHGEGGTRNGQEFLLGPSGSVYELDAFLDVRGFDLNGSAPGNSAQLSRHTLPPGLLFSFSSALSTNQAAMVLTYTFSNTTGAAFSDLRFFVLLDTEIDQATNTFFNEYGTVTGTAGQGAGDSAPDFWQIDEPGFQTGTLLRNLFLGSLSNSNAVSQSAPNDVALGLGFFLGTLKAGDSTSVRVMISEDGDSGTNAMTLVHRDLAPGSTTITLSGNADVKELPLSNVTSVARLSFQWRLNLPTGSLIGTLWITNTPAFGQAFGPPFQLGLQSSTNFFFVHPAGVLSNGLPYLDISAVILSQVGASGQLDPGATAVVDGIEIYSRDRGAPPLGFWELWATRLR